MMEKLSQLSSSSPPSIFNIIIITLLLHPSIHLCIDTVCLYIDGWMEEESDDDNIEYS